MAGTFKIKVVVYFKKCKSTVYYALFVYGLAGLGLKQWDLLT